MKALPNTRCSASAVHGVVFLLASMIVLLLAATAEAKTVKAKINWDVGTLDVGGAVFNLNYEDAHLEVRTKSYIEDGTDATRPEGPTVVGGAFPPPNPPTITHGPIGSDDVMTIDWQTPPGQPVVGRTHIGATVNLDTIYDIPPASDVVLRVTSATLTNVTCPATGGTSTPEMAIPQPGIKYGKGSINWEFRIDNPWLTNPVTFSNISFYKTNVEPASGDLTAVNFPPLSKTFLQSEPSFSLVYPQTYPVYIPNATEYDWLLVEFTTTWQDPWWSTQLGQPVLVDINTWIAMSTVPIDGDANLDGIVNILDLSLLSGNWQQTGKAWGDGDFNGDGTVNILDLSVLSGNWQATVAAAEGIAFATTATAGGVPEPGTLALLLLGGAALMRRRR